MVVVATFNTRLGVPIDARTWINWIKTAAEEATRAAIYMPTRKPAAGN
jgi:hypothetical protein